MEGTAFERYRLIELLGRGGMGEVWRALDTTFDRVVALKLLPAHFADDRIFRERLNREARAAAGLDNPHVIPIYDLGELQGRLYVSMALIDGRDMQTLIDNGPLHPLRAVWIIDQIASALNTAHRIGLVHRDVKPSNILVAKDDFAYLIDFGIARAEEDTRITSTGATIGTLAYMAPECLYGGEADARSDIYALTCVLHQSLTGQLPFPGNHAQAITGHLYAPPPRPSALRPAIPPSMDDVIATGMAKDPERRYTTAKDLARAARAALPDVSAAPSVATEPALIVDRTSDLAGVPDRLRSQRRAELRGPMPRWRDRRTVLGIAATVMLAAIGAATLVTIGVPIRESNSVSPQPISEPSSSPASRGDSATVHPETTVKANPPATIPQAPGQITYTITGTKAPGDIITVTFADSSGTSRTQRDVYIPWSFTLTPISTSDVGRVEASSFFKVSQLNCSITASDGTVLAENTSNSAVVTC